jgi:ribosome recycling factor
METVADIISDLKKRMDGALGSLRHSLNGLRTGRASISLLDPIKVEIYGSLMPLNQVATVSVPEPRLIVVQVWDKEAIKPVEKAIANAGLGLNPIGEGNVVRVPIPDLSEERRKELVKKAHEYCEQAKIAIRNVRRDGMEDIKKLEKDKHISEDDMKHHTDEIQKITDDHAKKIDEATQAKSKEIMNI